MRKPVPAFPGSRRPFPAGHGVHRLILHCRGDRQVARVFGRPGRRAACRLPLRRERSRWTWGPFVIFTNGDGVRRCREPSAAPRLRVSQIANLRWAWGRSLDFHVVGATGTSPVFRCPGRRATCRSPLRRDVPAGHGVHRSFLREPRREGAGLPQVTFRASATAAGRSRPTSPTPAHMSTTAAHTHRLSCSPNSTIPQSTPANMVE